ncbi:UPF0175 family protein [Bacillus pumilus]|uniref:UPF0175 family protein n=1 Tax=Bacillus pumilus TaxID=1408 RepID=UPI003315261F
MKSVTFNVPDDIDLSSIEITLLLTSKLYEQGKLSLGQAAQMAGLSKRTFIELLGTVDVSVFNYPISDLSTEVANA